MHTAAFGFFFDGVAGLAFGSDKEDVFALGDNLLDELFSPEQSLDGLLDVDDVDHVALAMDVGFHFGVPSGDPMAEMNTCIDERLDQFRL